jgi:bacterioferritin (cytochrome b1)
MWISKKKFEKTIIDKAHELRRKDEFQEQLWKIEEDVYELKQELKDIKKGK